MDDLKKRGKQHLKNKTKYKNKSKVPVQTPTILPALISNWDRYKDELPSTSDSYSPSGADFSILAEAPISKGSHFQFKSDAQDRFDVDNTLVDTSGLFNIDLNLLGLSLSCISFSERCAIPEHYFTDTQLNIMKKNAKDSARIYQNILKNNKLKISSKTKGKELFSSKNEETAEDQKGYFSTTNEIKSSSVQLRNILGNSCADEYDPHNSDKFMIECSNNTNVVLICPSIDKLNELEKKLDKLELIKSNSKNSQSEITESERLSSPVLINNEPSNISCDIVDHFEDNSGDTARADGSSLLETEYLQQWLDDVLGD